MDQEDNTNGEIMEEEQTNPEDGLIEGESQEPSVAERRKFTDIPERQAIAEGREPIGMSVAEWEDFHEGLVPYLGLNPKAKLCLS